MLIYAWGDSTLSGSSTMGQLSSLARLKKGSGSSSGLGAGRLVRDLHINLERHVPTVNILAHSPGCTTLDNLYTWNGTVYLVTDTPETLPKLHHINSGTHAPFGPILDYPEPDFIQTVTSEEARSLFGPHAIRQSGVTLLIKDTYLQHYAHFTLESVLALWTIYAAGVSPDGKTPLAFPDRIVFSLMDENSWRDGTVGMNAFILKNAFPGAAVQYMRDWEDRAEYGTVDVYDRVVYLDRLATRHASLNTAANKILADVALLPKDPQFWQPVRQSLLLSLPPSKLPEAKKLVVTYVSRQHAKAGRMLDFGDNDRLEQALRALEPAFEVNIMYFEEYARTEQIEIAARTDILLGLHGNGMTHLLWLPPSSLVVEMMYPGGWARDFELPATNIGHYHVAIHNDTLIRGEEMAPGMVIPDGFHKNGIPVKPEPIIAAIKAFQKGKSEGRKPKFPAHRTVFAEGRDLGYVSKSEARCCWQE